MFIQDFFLCDLDSDLCNEVFGRVLQLYNVSRRGKGVVVCVCGMAYTCFFHRKI